MAGTERTPRRSSSLRSGQVDRQQKTVPATGRRPRKTGDSGMPPVMARASTVSRSAYFPKPQRKVKRRFDFSVNTQGVEMRLPALPHVGLGWRAASFALAVFLVFAIYQFFTLPMFQVQNAEINGLQRITSQQVFEALEVVNTPVFLLDSQEISQTLLDEFREFSQAQVAITLPNSMVITVTERTPVLIWQTPSGSNLVDNEGMPFPLRENTVVTGLPTVEAEDLEYVSSAPQISEETLTILEQMLGQIPPELKVVSGPQRLISPEMAAAVLQLAKAAPEGAILIYSKDHGLGWKDRRGWPVYFGRPQDIEMKYQVYQYLWERLKGEENRPSLISVEYIHAPYYRLGQ